jgi:hypothetical protein
MRGPHHDDLFVQPRIQRQQLGPGGRRQQHGCGQREGSDDTVD